MTDTIHDAIMALLLTAVLFAIRALMDKRIRGRALAEFLIFIEAIVFVIESVWIFLFRFRNDYRNRRRELYRQVGA